MMTGSADPAPLLLPEESRRLFALPETAEDVVRHCTLSEEDVAWITTRRRSRNRLGFAVQLCCLRHPGRLLERDEAPPMAMLGYLAEQLELALEDFDGYARRDETRRLHAAEIMAALGLSRVRGADRCGLAAWLRERAFELQDVSEIVEAYLNELRHRHFVVPSQSAVERICRHAIANGRADIWKRLAARLTAEDEMRLETLLHLRPEDRLSLLAWLRHPPQASRPSKILNVFERLDRLRAIAVDRNRRDLIPRVKFNALVEEARRISAQRLGDYPALRRRATLIAAAIDLEHMLIDLALDLMGRFLSNLFNKSEQVHAEGVQSKGKMVAGQLQIHVDLVNLIAEAKETAVDVPALIMERIGWERMLDSAADSLRLIAGDAFNPLSELGDKYGSLKGVAGPFLETFAFEGAPAAKPVLRAVTILRGAYRTKATDLPQKLPTAFVKQKWSRFVFPGEGGSKTGKIDRRYYEFCAFEALFQRLRAGDIWVEGSVKYAPFEENLIAPEAWQLLREDRCKLLDVETDFDTFLRRTQNELHDRLSHIDRLAAVGALPDAVIDENGLRIGRVEGLKEAKQAEPFARRLYAAIPGARITELLAEVNRWTDFTSAFTHLRTGRPPAEIQPLLSVVLADGTNMSLTRMAEASAGYSIRQLAWTADWYVRKEAYDQALARIVDVHHRQPLTAAFGDSRISSSDGQHFRAGGPAEARSLVNAKYGYEPGAAFYTHVSGSYGPYRTKMIAASAGEAPYVVDGLQDHGCDLAIDTHHTDTGGVSDHVFGLTALLGFRFAPRIRNLRDRKIYTLRPTSAYPALKPIIQGRINCELLRASWQDLLRFAASVKIGAIPASVALKRLAAYPKQNLIAAALREYGRIIRTLFILDWAESPDIRRQATEELNKGEGRNSLSRAVFYHRLGEIRDRTPEAQANRASGLNLIVSAIILWNTVYLARVIESFEQRREPIPDRLLRHIAPLGWEHINLAGDYMWNFDLPETPDGYRLLRNPDADLLAA